MVPDSFGKRNRDAVKARKAAERDDRRVARNRRRNPGAGPTGPRLNDLMNVPPRGQETGTEEPRPDATSV